MSGSRRSRSRRLAVLATACAAALVPATSALAQPSDAGPVAAAAGHASSPVTDLRSPDARDAALAATTTPASRTDPRSPDARDAALAATTTPASRTDPRSPDARDAALAAGGHAPATAAPPTVIVHEDASALPLYLSIAALFVALAGWGLVAIRRTATRPSVPGLGH